MLIGGIFLSLHRKSTFFVMGNKKPFIQKSTLNIMDVLHHKKFGCYAVYDKDFLRWYESGGFWEKMDEI